MQKEHEHASADFLKNREDKYKNILAELTEFFKKHNTTHRMHPTARMASLNTLVKNNFSDFNFVGFYVVVEVPFAAKAGKERVLEIGPYQSDHLAVPRILYGKGVCGTCWETKTTQVVNAVKECSNYIACDHDTNSEIVLPVYKSRADRTEVVAVWDIDSLVKNRFADDVDKKHLEQLIELFMYE